MILDQWHNAAVGSSIARFVSQIEKAEAVVVVGTPLYRRKYENKVSKTGSVVAAEVDLIDQRLLGTEQQKASVYPVLLDGTASRSLPPLMQGRVYADFHNEADYLPTMFDLILSIYRIPPDDRAVMDLRASLRPERL